jgi:hypothetical protein
MLRSFSPRRKFSFDLALHKSKEKKKDKASDDGGFAAIVDGLNRSEEPRGRAERTSRKGSFFRSSRDDGGGRREPSARGSSPEPTRQSWLRMREARQRAASPRCAFPSTRARVPTRTNPFPPASRT